MVLAFGFLLLATLLFSTALASFGRFFTAHLSLPRALRWKDVWQGALATAVLFTVGKALLGLYLGMAAVGSAYGAAGSLVVVIV